MRLASLPWYDLREVRPAHDALWSAIAERLRRGGIVDVPERLERRIGYAAQWSSGRLLLGQACGYDIVTAQARSLRIVATPCFDVEGCVGPYYRSFVVVRRGSPARALADLRGSRCVINGETSHSGMNALWHLVARREGEGAFFRDVLVSGAHEHSVALLADGAADVAAIDCITWALLAHHRPHAVADLRIVGTTDPAPAPPFVTSAETPHWHLEVLRAALHDVLAGGYADTPWSVLRLRGASVMPRGAYDAITCARRGLDPRSVASDNARHAHRPRCVQPRPRVVQGGAGVGRC